MGNQLTIELRASDETPTLKIKHAITSHYDEIKAFLDNNEAARDKFSDVAGREFPGSKFEAAEWIEDALDDGDAEEMQEIWQFIESQLTQWTQMLSDWFSAQRR